MVERDLAKVKVAGSRPVCCSYAPVDKLVKSLAFHASHRGFEPHQEYMDTNYKGNLGEAKVLAYFIEEGYEIYTSFGTASSNDMIVIKDNIVSRVSVKSTTMKTESGTWNVRLRQRRAGKDYPFDKTKTDIIAIYIIPENRIVILKSKDIDNTMEIRVK